MIELLNLSYKYSIILLKSLILEKPTEKSDRLYIITPFEKKLITNYF